MESSFPRLGTPQVSHTVGRNAGSDWNFLCGLTEWRLNNGVLIDLTEPLTLLRPPVDLVQMRGTTLGTIS